MSSNPQEIPVVEEDLSWQTGPELTPDLPLANTEGLKEGGY